MAKKQQTQTLNRKERVIAATDLRGVPEGTQGRVILSNGFDWVRYWVHFDNGIEMGSIHRDKLVRVAEWDSYLVERELSAAQALEGGDSGADEGTDDSEDSSGGDGNEATVNGVAVPQLLLDRTQSALDRFGVSR